MAVYDRYGIKQNGLYDAFGKPIKQCFDQKGNPVVFTDYITEFVGIVSMSYTQGFDIYDGTLFWFRTPSSAGGRDLMNTVDLDALEIINADIVIQAGHGNSASFSDEFPEDGDFPLIYISEDTTVYTQQGDAKVFVCKVAEDSGELVKTYKFPLATTGYYACLCLDYENKIMYMLGYTIRAHNNPDSGNNRVIITKWDYTNCAQNEDETYTPAFISSNTVDFIETMQGQTFHDGLIWVTSSAYDSTAQKRLESMIYAIDPESYAVVKTIHTGEIKEIEGISFISDNEAILGFQSGMIKRLTLYDN